MLIEAGDDIGLYKVGILFQINDGPLCVLCEQNAAGAAEPFSLSRVLLLEEQQLSYKDSVTYYAFAEDNYFDEVRRTTSELRYIDIRPFQTAFQVVEGEGTCNGCSTTLEELIVRQRQNLGLAFAAQQESPLEKETTDRLSENQSELLTKTREFEQGIAERVDPIAALAKAVVDMQSAVAALGTRQMAQAVVAEQQALSDLIRARENVRQKLNQSSSQSASACRKFDREQRQKLRMPEKKKPQDKEQQVADLRKKLDELAQRERKWSQECRQCNRQSASSQSSPSSKSQSAKSQSSKSLSEQQQSSSPQKSSSPQGEPPDQQPGESRSPAELAQDQEKLRAEFDQLRQRLEKLTAAGAAARDQAQQADQSMQQGLNELEKQDALAAAKEAERSAQQLDRLADHLAAMNGRDFGQRLDQAQKLARQLADRQQSLEASQQQQGSSGNSSPNNNAQELARSERGLAGEADLLADQLAALESDASKERGGVQRKLRDLQADNSPREISSVMRQAADDLEANRQDQAGRGAAQARKRLDELSRSLRNIQGDYSQPGLEELIALEQQLANLLQQSQRAEKGEGKATPSQQKWNDLERRLEGPAKGDQRLAKAMNRMREGTTPEGHYSWLELADFSGPREVAKVLQMKIQEAILAGAMQDADQPVPREYKALVEKYYRALSDDLR